MNYVLSTVFCDDIRLENNGKLFLIGVYQDDLIPAFLPQTIPLAIWSRLLGVPPGVFDILVRVGVNDAVQHELPVKLNILETSRSANIHLVGIPIQVDAPSTVVFEIVGLPNQGELKSTFDVRPVPDSAVL